MANPIHEVIKTVDAMFAACRVTPYQSKTAPTYPPSALAERAQLQSDIEKSQRVLARFRTVDEPARRADVGRKLVTLSFAVSLAVESGCPDERLDVVTHHINLFNQAQDALADIKGDIRLAEMEIDDARRTLADVALWMDDNGGAA